MELNIELDSGNKAILVTDVTSGNITGIAVLQVIKVTFTKVSNIPLPSNARQTQYNIHLHLTDGTRETFPLGGITNGSTDNNITNQPTWVNTLAGAQAAVSDIISWL